MRLIDTDALIEMLLTENQRCITSTGHELTMSMIVSFIENQPTAYDVEKVVAELERQRRIMMPVIPTKEAIDIVKRGGVE